MTRSKKNSPWQRQIRRFFLLLLLGFIVALAVAWALAPSLLEPKFKSWIEQKGSEAFKGDVVVGDLTLRSVVPLSLKARQIQVIRTDGTLQIMFPEVDIDVHFGNPLADFPSFQFRTRLTLLDPFFRMTLLPGKEQIGESSDEKSGGGFFFPLSFDTSMDTQIQRGQVEFVFADKIEEEEKATRLQFKNIGLLLRQDSLFHNRSPMSLNLSLMAGLKTRLLTTSIPVQISSEEIFTSPERIEAKRINVDFGGLIAAAAGSTDLKPLQHNWLVRFQVPDLGQLKVPPQFLPPGVWAGAFSGKIHFAQKPQSSPYVAVQALVQGFRGDTEWKKENLELVGGVGADARIDAVYWDKWKFNDLFAVVDLSGAKMTLDPWFRKKSNERLRVHVVAKQEGPGLRIDKGDLEFTRLRAFVRGFIQEGPGGRSKLQVKIPPTNLGGFEAFFPFLKEQSLQGELEVNARLDGDLSVPESLAIDLAPLKLSGVSANVKYANKETQMYAGGPVQVTADVQISAKGTDLSRAKGSVAADFTRLGIVIGEKFRKKPGQVLALRASASKLDDKVLINSLALTHPAGEIRGKGFFKQPQKPIFDLSLGVEELNLRQAARVMPILGAYGVGGSVDGSVRLTGTYDFALGLEKSPIKMTGDLQARLPNLNIPMADGEANPDHGIESQVEAKAILPDWPLFNQSKMILGAQVGQLSLGRETFKKVSADMIFSEGSLKGGARVASLFGGSLVVTELTVPLRQILPLVPMKMEFKGVDLNRAVSWWSPEKKGLVRGVASVDSALNLPWPKGEGWWHSLRAEGRLGVRGFSLSTLNWEEKIQQALSQLPGQATDAKDKSQGRQVMAAELDIAYKAQNEKIQIKKLSLKTPRKNDLSAEGELGFDLVGELKGELSLANPPVKGSVKDANSDELGRLIVPLEISGDLTSPSLSVAGPVIEKMLAKTLAFEKKKTVAQVESKVKDETKKAVATEKKKVKESIDKKIKGLFNRK
ncbi:MAG: hypothetical protein H6624_03300 [Bdellovibrionaceae bacterium]|nr:hypothetical protein [Bdellovibrionales bacterium]MCB9083341.1 hypothetical protein [Pseudobdellovibrionaceae bacterium]